MKYLAIDNETGGFAGTSLLTSYFAVLDSDLNFVDDLYLFLKPSDGIYRIEPRALEINGINLSGHDAIAETQSMAGQKLFRFLKTHSSDGADKLIPLGHNVIFDVLGVHEQLLNRSTFEKFTSYRKLDTAVICQFLKLAGSIPNEVSGSLESLIKHFELTKFREGVGALHDAKTDVLMTVEVLKCMLKLAVGMPIG